ncbi:hypothetical protein GUJ93_ZPchr0007g4645 [Zizania palustris]|uniref:Formin-like protein n=1 Tax=Zizania palustris TaxID=103762 RepID=A0A8J5ST89_ZIZPA|nr:hypothetical protein GUJ93_ZPchr0007g4645 [Zizania palustris]
MRRRVALGTVVALFVAEQLCAAVAVEVAAAAGSGGVWRRSLHQPFFPIEWSPPPPMSGSSDVPPPPAEAAAATNGGARSSSGVTNTVAIALSAGLVAFAVASYSCCLLLRRRREDGEDDGRAAKSVGAVAVRAPSDVGSSSHHHRSPPPSSTASDAIYLDPLTTLVEVRQHRQSPDLRPLPLLKQPSPDLRPLPPLKRPERQPPPPPPATPPITTTGYSSDEDQATFYTASKTAKSSFSRSTSQRSTLEQTAMPSVAAVTAAPPQTNPLRPPPRRPPPPPPPMPRQRLVRPLPAESPPPAALANLELTSRSPADTSVQDRGGQNSGGQRPPKPPHLKPLHWDKLRAISGRTTVWDQVKNSDSFRVDEEAMETLFLNSSGAGSSDPAARRGGTGKQDSHLLDPKRLQNVAIMLKALNVTADEVIAALVHGNAEDVGSEFYETLAQMAPTKEEELKLKGYSGDLSKIDPAESFLKGVLGVPFPFERVDAMLYRANFDTELNYLRTSFGTLEAACAELRSSKLFLKLLDAVLKTGNRMNDGTNRGEARAFKLDTLLKLADIKSTDGKTTLLHFVVKEIIRSEGIDSDQSAANPGSSSKEQFKKDGLKLLAGLSSELSNVKRAATLEMDTLSGNILRLETDLQKVKLVLQLKETCSDQGSSESFFEAMDVFLGRAEAEIRNMKTAEGNVSRHVKETTEYFHGDATREEPHPLRVFVVVDEFLVTLDRVCRDVGRTPERVVMGSGKAFRVTAGTSLPPRRYEPRRALTSSDEDSSSS